MNDEIDYQNNPLHGVGLKTVLTEIVDYYGFEILFAYLNINCFKANPSIASSVKFLKKTTWAREKVEAFYLYKFKNLPRVSSEQFTIAPRDRVVPAGQVPGKPADLSLADAERLNENRVRKAAGYDKTQAAARSHPTKRYGTQPKRSSEDQERHYSRKSEPNTPDSSSEKKADPWGNWKK